LKSDRIRLLELCLVHDRQQVPWTSEGVERQLREVLGRGGGLFDGALYIQPLWLSVLRHWFSRADGATVYIASPLLDPIRLAVTISTYLHMLGTIDPKKTELYSVLFCHFRQSASCSNLTVTMMIPFFKVKYDKF